MTSPSTAWIHNSFGGCCLERSGGCSNPQHSRRAHFIEVEKYMIIMVHGSYTWTETTRPTGPERSLAELASLVLFGYIWKFESPSPAFSHLFRSLQTSITSDSAGDWDIAVTLPSCSEVASMPMYTPAFSKNSSTFAALLPSVLQHGFLQPC